jgi:hypothetical protein
VGTRGEPKGPAERTIKRLFALSGNRCAFPRCATALIQGDTVVGQVCHIKAAKPGGSRYDDQQTNGERHAFANLILMCGTHHTVIDDDEEAYTVERLAKLKAEHEKGAAPIDDHFAERAAQLLISQTVTSANQSGGITANTVNAETINLHPPSILALGAGAPDWSIQELFYYLRPNLSPNGPTALWDEVGGDVLDKLSSGQLHAWGREIVRGATTTFHSLAPIDRAYWRVARFTYAFLLDEHERDVHAKQHAQSTLPDYADLRVNRENAVKLWPHPLRGRWNVQSITLTARYFNHPADQVSVGCKLVTLFDPHIETKCDANGAPQYQQLVAPAYILATGVDPIFIRSLVWKPQQLSFIDLATNTEQEYMLTGTVDASATKGRAKFFLDAQAALAPQPISPDTLARTTEFFAARMNYVQANIDAPAVLRHGAKLILQVLPTSALDDARTIDHAAPQLLARYFMPDGYQKVDGRPRQEGWVWHQPPQPMAGLPNPASQWHSRLDWNGFVEIMQVLDEADEKGRVEVIRGYPLERYIVKTLDAVSEGYRQLNLRSPVIIRVELLGVLGTKLVKPNADYSKGFDRSVVASQVLGLTDMTKPLGRALRPILDSLWRAAGWADGSPSYGCGDWDGYDNPYPYG